MTARWVVADRRQMEWVPALALAGREELPRLSLSVSEACATLGVGWDFWREHVEPELRVVRVGRRKLVAVSELVAWLDRHGEQALATGKVAPTADESPANRGVRATRAPVSGARA
jgi:hypothetical protein